MTGHEPFIVFSYLFGALILGWTALSPLIRKHRLLNQLDRLAHRDSKHDPNA